MGADVDHLKRGSRNRGDRAGGGSIAIIRGRGALVEQGVDVHVVGHGRGSGRVECRKNKKESNCAS